MQIYEVFLRCYCDKCGKEIGGAQLAYQFPVDIENGWMVQFQLNQTRGGWIDCLDCTKKAIAEAAKKPKEEEVQEREHNWED